MIGISFFKMCGLVDLQVYHHFTLILGDFLKIMCTQINPQTLEEVKK